MPPTARGTLEEGGGLGLGEVIAAAVSITAVELPAEKVTALIGISRHIVACNLVGCFRDGAVGGYGSHTHGYHGIRAEGICLVNGRPILHEELNILVRDQYV